MNTGFEEFYKKYVGHKFEETNKDICEFVYYRALEDARLNYDYQKGLADGIRRKEVANLNSRDAWLRALRKTFYVEMVTLLGKYENDYIRLQKNLTKKINNL